MVISLRNVPPDVENAIRERSRREGISLNKAATALLEAAIRRPARNADFDEFPGLWSKEEGDNFDAALAEMRQVAAEDWNE
jgi:hypothetical protein